MTPAWLYAGWKYLAARPDIIKRGWDACSLCSMFDERRVGVVRQAELATHATSHRLYPLFPSNDLAALPLEVAAGKLEPKMEPLYEKTKGAATQEQLEEAERPFIGRCRAAARCACCAASSGNSASARWAASAQLCRSGTVPDFCSSAASCSAQWLKQPLGAQRLQWFEWR
jgi:hypothetical protein